MRTFRLLILTFLFGLLTAAPASAHRLVLFASGDGTGIAGKLYMAAGSAISGQTIVIEDGDGRRIGDRLTGDEGRFAFSAADLGGSTGPWHLIADLGDGHRAESIIAVGDTPLTVESARSSESDRHLDRRLTNLEERLDALAEKRRIQDVIGALGYLAGLCGLAFFLLGRRPGKDS